MPARRPRSSKAPTAGRPTKQQTSSFAPGEGADDRLVRWPEVHAITGRSRMTIDRLEAVGKFPRRVQLGPNSVAWVLGEIRAWVREQVAARDRTAKPAARDSAPERSPTAAAPVAIAAASARDGRRM